MMQLHASKEFKVPEILHNHTTIRSASNFVSNHSFLISYHMTKDKEINNKYVECVINKLF